MNRQNNITNTKAVSSTPSSTQLSSVSTNTVKNMITISSPGIRLVNPPCLIAYRHMRFLLMDAPSESTVHLYLKEMGRNNVTDLVRVCEPTYSRSYVEASGIRVHDWIFPDGAAPPQIIIHQWLKLVREIFVDDRPQLLPSSSEEESDYEEKNDVKTSNKKRPAIAVHCIAGLGRAPVLIAIALIENGMDPFDAVMFIRKKRRGAINQMQLKFLESYYHKHLRGRNIASKCTIL